MKFSILILIPSIINLLINCIEPSNIKDTFLDWGIKNNLNISPFIELSSNQEKNKIRFIAKEDIPRKQLLLTIPYSLMFNISKILDLINSKNLNKQYKEFSKLNLTYDFDPNDFRKEGAFISYIKVYSFKSPIFYEQNQVEYLAGTHLSNFYDVMKKVYQTEINIFNNETYYKKELDFDEYVRNRLIVYNKGVNISNTWCLVPFLNFFDKDYSTNNAKYIIEKNGDIKIIARRKIKKGEEIILKADKISNIRRLLLEGKTCEKLVNYFDEYMISAFSPGLYYSYGLNDIQYFKDYYINLKDEDFDSKANKIYFDKADMLGGDGSDNWAYDVLENNLHFYKEHFEKITVSQIYDVFYDKDDRINIERIYRGEKKVIDDAYNKVIKIIDKFTEIQEKYMKDGKNSKNAKIIDL